MSRFVLVLSFLALLNEAPVFAAMNHIVVEESDPFPLSVASGDPTPVGFLAMTHLDRRFYNSRAPTMRLDVSTTSDFSSSVSTYIVPINPRLYDAQLQEWYIKAPIQGLEPWTRYFYRFSYGAYQSRVGRAHTLPRENQEIDHLTLGIVTCQDYSTGHYVAYKHLARDPHVHFVVHLGDAIYEYDRYPGIPADQIIHKISLPDGVDGQGEERGVRKASTLRDYRYIYGLERRDPDFRAVLENHTFIFTLDDHELWDNASWNTELNLPAGPAHDPRTPRKLDATMNAALQAWTEFLPVSSYIDLSKPLTHGRLTNPFKSYRFGTMGELYALNSRLFRSNSLQRGIEHTMLGAEQKRWLLNGIQRSSAKWQLLGNQTLMAPFRIAKKPVNLDAWDGYPDDRRAVLEALSRRTHVAVFTGDMHTSLVSYLMRDFSFARDKRNTVGAEFMTPSISSPHFTDAVRSKIHFGTTGLSRKVAKSNNRHFKHFHGSIYGYSVATMRGDAVDWSVYKVDKRDPNSGVIRRKHMVYNADTKKISKLPHDR